MTDAKPGVRVRVLGPVLDKATFIQRASEARTRVPTNVPASSLHLECNRQLGYPLMGVPAKELEVPEWLRNASTGTSLHENYQKLMLLMEELTFGTETTVRVATSAEVLEHAGLTLQDYPDYLQKRGLNKLALEMPTPVNPHRISGRGDGVFFLNGSFTWIVEEKGFEPEDYEISFDNELVVVEIKTVKHKDWVGIETKSSNKYKKFYAQMQGYMHFYKIRKCILFMINRNDDSVKEILLQYDPEYVEAKLSQIADMWSYVDRGVVPPATFDQWGDCKFCPFKAKCDVEEMLNG